MIRFTSCLYAAFILLTGCIEAESERAPDEFTSGGLLPPVTGPNGSEVSCGDGVIGDGEACDDGNALAGDGCAPDCTLEATMSTCGDGQIEGAEACDDGNTVDGDGCSSRCVIEDSEPVCGNGTLEQGEACDDGNLVDDDGCSAACQEETRAECGNGALEPGEDCDDGNLDEGDGCSATCQTEDGGFPVARCGDGVLNQDEECDDGNTADGDGCSSRCETEVEAPRCGDGVLAAIEECDDGNQRAGDGCAADCTVELNLQIPEERLEILEDIPGYAQDTVGGAEGELYLVTHLGNAGPGSLRAGLESPDPLWIVFQDGLDGTIRLEDTIYAKSYKTVDARGHQITLQGVRDENAAEPEEGWHNTGISLGREQDLDTVVRDVIFLNLTFDGDWEHSDTDGQGADGIHLRNRVFNVWVHQCTFHNWIDGGIDALSDDGSETMPRDISITNSHFHDMHQGLRLQARRVTFARNYCDNINVRCVKSVDGGNAHVINNVIQAWRGAEIVFARNDSQILVDHNVFRPGPDSRQPGRTVGDGRIQDVHNVWYGRLWAFFDSMRMGDRSDVSNSFKSEAQSIYGERKVNCDHEGPDNNCWQRLYDTVVQEAGANIEN